MRPVDAAKADAEDPPVDRAEALRPLIYIVDDEAVVSDLVEMHLHRRGYRTRVFHDPVLAYSAITFDAEKPSLLITDLAMRAMSGLELIWKCKELLPGLKTIGTSGSLAEEALRAAKVKPDAFLGKPFTMDSLFVAVAALVCAT